MPDQIMQDSGNTYLFKPGKYGSLTQVNKPKSKQMDLSYRKVAKVVPILKSMRKRVAERPDTASSRG